jgi:hypothetical protein
MNLGRPGIIAIRAVNQYRRRDVLAYLGLRYYLANSASRTNLWARRASTNLVSTRNVVPYFHAYNFKEVSQDGEIQTRSLHLPGANEALAESALLAACAQYPDVFDSPECVFSYKLSGENDRDGVFENYSKGLRRRHAAVEDAAYKSAGGVVQYVDIKRFYPSISQELALRAWQKNCANAKMPNHMTALGERIIEDHCAVQRVGEKGILTGPMFSHLLANLVLHDLDIEMSHSLPARYFRYVDDIILVGKTSEVNESLLIVEAKLSELNFYIHPEGTEKHLCVPVDEWLEGANDFKSPFSQKSWPAFVYNLKRFLLIQKGDWQSLRDCLRESGFRMPVTDYSSIIYEAGWVERVKNLAREKWYRARALSITLESLVGQAKWLRAHHLEVMEILMSDIEMAKGYKRKRLVPKIRFAAGRLIYLATEAELASIGTRLIGIPELYLHGHVMLAIAHRQLDKLLPLGANAAQAAAQPLATNEIEVRLSTTALSETEKQSLAILIMNGVPVKLPDGIQEIESEVMQIAMRGCDPKLMRSQNPFLRELACLHGLASEPRHADMFKTAFDQDDDLVLDAIDLLQEYPSP